MTTPSTPVIETHPLTPGRWRDFAELMNSRYDTRHCWCMWPRMTTNYRTRTDATNKRAFKKVVDSAKTPPGVLAYVDGVPAGWCAVAPRDDYPKLTRSRATAPVDDQPVWSVVCFFIRRGARGRGLSKTLLSAAVELATQHGAKIVEGYPVEGGSNLFRGVAAVFTAAGFKEVARRAPNRPFMRYSVKPARGRAGAVQVEAPPFDFVSALPDSIRSALESRGLVEAYSRRSAAQEDHYVRRILRAVRVETVQKRLEQMLDELDGDLYMKKPWMPR